MGFRVDTSDLTRGLGEAKLKAMYAVEAYGKAAAAKLEQREPSRTRRGRTRTGLARQTISGVADWAGSTFRIGVAGNMNYSPYLELARATRITPCCGQPLTKCRRRPCSGCAACCKGERMDALEKIRETLQDADYLVYEPGQAPNACNAPYVVVRGGGTYPFAGSNKTGYTLANVTVYVPLDQYDQLATMTAQVQTLLTPLYNQARPTGNIGPDIIEEEYQAHSKSLEYMILKPL